MPVRDRVIIRDLQLRAIVGTTPWEREEKQDVLIDVTLYLNVEEAGRNDDPEETIDYHALTKAISQHVESSQYHLLEALATAIARICVVDFKVLKVVVRVEKPDALHFARAVGVEIEREEDDF